MNVLEKSLKHRPNQSGVILANPNKPVVQDSGFNMVEGLAKVGTHIIDSIAKQENQKVKADYKQAVQEKERIEGVNRDISFTRTKSYIDTQQMEFEKSLTGNDFLNEGAIHQAREERKNGMLEVISSDSILDVEQKEKLKAYVTGIDNDSKMKITAKSYQARQEKMEVDTLNDREDSRVAIGLAILNDDQVTANRLIVEDRQRRKQLQRLNPKKYNNEWSNKEGSDLVVYAGMSVVNKAFNNEVEMFLQNPNEANYKVMEKNIFDKQREFTNPEFLKAMYGSEHGLEYEEFLEKTKSLGDRALNLAKSKARASNGFRKREREANQSKVINNTSGEYASVNGLTGDPPKEAFSPEGDMMSWAYNETAESYLEEKGVVIENNQQLFAFLEEHKDDPNLPKLNVNLLGKQNVESIALAFKEGNYVEAHTLLNNLVGAERIPELDNLLNSELIKTSDGAVSLQKLYGLSGMNSSDSESMPVEKREKIKKSLEYSNSAENDNLVGSVVPLMKDNLKSLEFDKNTKAQLFDLDRLASGDRESSLVAKNLNRDITSGLVSMALGEMSAKEREEFANGNLEDKQEMIEKKLKKSNLKEKAQDHINNLMDFYLGENKRPVTYKGKTSVLDKNITPKKISSQIVDSYKNGGTLYFDDGEEKSVTLGTITSDTASRVHFKAEKDGTAGVYFGNKRMYKKVNGENIPFSIDPNGNSQNETEQSFSLSKMREREIENAITGVGIGNYYNQSTNKFDYNRYVEGGRKLQELETQIQERVNEEFIDKFETMGIPMELLEVEKVGLGLSVDTDLSSKKKDIKVSEPNLDSMGRLHKDKPAKIRQKENVVEFEDLEEATPENTGYIPQDEIGNPNFTSFEKDYIIEPETEIEKMNKELKKSGEKVKIVSK